MAGRRGPLTKQELPPKQAKITTFFKKGPVQPSPEKAASSSQPRVVNRIPLLVNLKERKTEKPQLPIRSWSDDEGDILDVQEVERRPSSPKEVIDLISSDDEDGGEKKNNSNSATISPSCPSEDNLVQNELGEGEQEMGEEETNNNNAQTNTATSNDTDTQEDDQQEDDETYSSGDEILSRIDVEEIIRLSQSSAEMSENDSPVKVTPDEAYVSLSTVSSSSVPDKENLQQLSSSTSTSSTSISASLKSPRKVAKSKMNKFSPVRQYAKMKRTSSEASLRSPGSGSPSPLRKRTNISTNDNFHKSSPKKKLEFGPTPTSSQDNPASQKSNGNTPYYLKNFMSILTDVMSDKFNAHLINKEDRQTVQQFVTLPLETQCLYIRLLQRKWDWKPMSKLNNKYKEIPKDVTKLCEELKRLNLIEEMSSNNATLEDVLNTLDLQKMTSLCKKLNVSSAKKTKDSFVKAILQKLKNQPTLTGGSGASQILKSALAELGAAFRITAHSKSFFSRLFLLHAPPQYWEVEADQTANQLLLLLLNNLGQMEYVPYKINKSTVIFRTREDLVRFHDAFKLHSDLMSFTESQDWDEVVKITEEAKKNLNVILEDESTDAPRKHDATLPSYLRIYTAGSVLSHTCWMGVNGYQKLKMFDEANELLRMLLGQQDYLPRYRGRWWERISINSTHLKLSKIEARTLLEQSLDDPDLKENHQLILSQRLVKISNSIALEEKKNLGKRNIAKVTKQGNKRGKGRRRKRRISDGDTSSSNDESTELDELDEKREAIPNPQRGASEMQKVQCKLPHQQQQLFALKNEIPTRTITGEKIDRGPKMMGKSVFLGLPDANGSRRLVSVEQHAIDYYTENEGYTTGIHGEGATVCSLYGLLFWEIIFNDELPDAFHNRYQPFPLDFHFNEFYSRRQTLIEEKLTLIRDVLSVEDLCGLIDHVWRENEKRMSIVTWSLVEDTQALKSLMRAMGTKMIASICERLANNYRHYSSGFPDIVVWNEATRKVLFAEVKGPGDKLSAKQELWLDFLTENGINCEVCHVKAVSNKRFGRQN